MTDHKDSTGHQFREFSTVPKSRGCSANHYGERKGTILRVRGRKLDGKLREVHTMYPVGKI